ncbi:MAG: phosphotransferase [Microbacteriaceae bacterium]|nr:phosphotransferase [Microbacteriaceae bacterium]
MARQRWYTGKGRVPRLRTVGDIPLASADPEARIRILLLADDADPRGVVYQVPVVERREVPAGAEAHLIGPDGDRAMLDGPHDPAFGPAVLEAISSGAAPRGSGGDVLTGEQSNTSIVVDTDAGELLVKVFRTVRHGRNPDAELHGALSTAGGDLVPRFVGTLDARWSDAGPDEPRDEGLLATAQEFLPDAEDAWRIARRSVDNGADFSRSAFELGRATAALHAALVACFPAAAPGRDAVADTAGMWAGRLEAAIRDVPELGIHRTEIEAAYAAAAAAHWPRLQRIHGDLHLGQVLRTGSGESARWAFIDFEGEPLRAMEERTRPEPALRDLAGMLRSFDYAAASSGHPDADAWARRAGDAYLAGYADGGGADPDHALLVAFELDKAVYEVSYEARNRPSWLPIPLRAVDRLTTRSLA